MSGGELLILLPLAALFLWLTLFIFTLIDHFVYRGTYGHFLVGLDAIYRRAGTGQAGIAAFTEHMRQAKDRYLASYLAKAASSRIPARIAATTYLERMGVDALLDRAADFRGRRVAPQVTALYALARTGHPDVLPLLERALCSPRPILAYAALDMLDICDSVGAAEVLVRGIEAEILPASRIATHLEHFRTELNPLYVSRLTQGNPKSRYWIAYLLGKSSYSHEADEILASLLSDPEAGVRKIALSSLAALDAPGLQARAESMLEDPVFFVRTQAVRILSLFPNREAVRALAPMLCDDEDAVQLAAKKSLVDMGAVTLQFFDGAAAHPDGRIIDKIAEITSSIRNAELVEQAGVDRA